MEGLLSSSFYCFSSIVFFTLFSLDQVRPFLMTHSAGCRYVVPYPGVGPVLAGGHEGPVGGHGGGEAVGGVVHQATEPTCNKI